MTQLSLYDQFDALEPQKEKPSFRSSILCEYDEVKWQYPDAMILFRSDDFYVTYEQDAIEAAKILCITLTHVQWDDNIDTIPMAGFPFHELDRYLPKLVRAGKRVCIADAKFDLTTLKGKMI
ncbi:MAG: hypothetical protein J5733_03065 [Bacteroidaceae bacterium]|nr:hypothetical protein [Bacteroidaceae bacterium]